MKEAAHLPARAAQEAGIPEVLLLTAGTDTVRDDRKDRQFFPQHRFKGEEYKEQFFILTPFIAGAFILPLEQRIREKRI